MSQAQRRVPLTELRERVPTASPSDRHYTNAERRLLLLPPRRDRASPASPIDRHCTNAERRLLLLPQRRERASPASPTNAASYPELSKPVRRVPPDRHAGIELLRLHRTVQTNAASYPPKVTQFAGLRSEQKQLTALTIGNEGIQMQWHSRAHTRKHEAALPPVLMFFL